MMHDVAAIMSSTLASTTTTSTPATTSHEEGHQQQQENDATEEEAVVNPCCCSFAVTGAQPTYQSIFVCETCCSNNPSGGLLCVCEACANHCHQWHDEINYIGMGKAYCDCAQLLSCKLKHSSQKLVQEWKLPELVHTTVQDTTKSSSLPFAVNVFSIAELTCNTDVLVEQAQELVHHSKDTFWLGQADDEDDQELCPLEQLAWRVFQQHVQWYGIEVQDSGGAEWWVQVKKTTPDNNNDTLAPNDSTTNGSAGNNNNNTTAIDLHYDKDEVLAEKFGLGAFPTLSTVTYLTGGNNNSSNPTVIFERTYEQDDEEVIPSMLVSHPIPGKHLVFDGRLLHGAPSHPALRQSYQPKEQNNNRDTTTTTNGDHHPRSGTTMRVTFLVNIWPRWKPAGVHPLPNAIRTALLSQHDQDNASSLPFSLISSLEFTQQTIPEVVLEDDTAALKDANANETIQEDTTANTTMNNNPRIELPFVCKGITWESEDEESGGLVLVTCPPPQHHQDTLFVRFPPGLQAYLETQYSQDEPPHDNELPPSLVDGAGYEEAYV
ncbi:expressed unknown protein [Seminavis robusta]|uniref:UBR-type domain-containing protein n=1 Tax=Seminavis robusta TaxID=568900 RepID=A0A9N8EU69_9STRA|nr:expressed unknown protein [Seminavis robusta]|eukprot:Sro1637_g287630.1 n/a (548) ;mRNA; f:7884-9527